MGKHGNIVYIVGYGRSGSTFLNRLLGSATNSYGLGEVAELPARILGREKFGKPVPEHGKRCDCGKKISDCMFWSSVLQGLNQDDLKKLDIFNKNVLLYTLKSVHWRINILLGAEDRVFSDHYQDLLCATKKFITNSDGDYFMIDSSKSFIRLLDILKNKVDMKVIFLTRDIRGVIASMEKQNYHWLRTCFAWLYFNLVSLFTYLQVDTHKRIWISYDLFCTFPREYLFFIKNKFGLDINLEQVFQSDDKHFHVFGGSGSRNKPLKAIKHSTAWKEKFPYWKKVSIKILFGIFNYLFVYSPPVKRAIN